MEGAANPSRCGAPQLLTTHDLGHGSTAGTSLLRLPGRATASPSGDLEQQGPDEERTTTVTRAGPRRRRRHPAQDQRELSTSPLRWMATIGTPRSSQMSSMARSPDNHDSPENKKVYLMDTQILYAIFSTPSRYPLLVVILHRHLLIFFIIVTVKY